MPTYRELLKQATSSISSLDAELLLAHVLDKPREFLIAHDNEKIGLLDYLKIQRLIKKRKNGIPLAYLIGYKEFYGLDFFVNKHTLVPRPDTELMVEEVVQEIKKSKNQKITLIDVGTGSGCIPISILDAIRTSGLSVIRKCYATDISKNALKVAKKNAKKQNVHITFKQGNLLEPFTNQLIDKSTNNLIITANLPYLTQTQFDEEPSIQHEPHSALVTNKEGLALYEELLHQVKKQVPSFQFPVTMFFEIDPSQTENISSMIKTIFPKATIEIKKDLSGKDRIVKIVL